MRRARSRTAIAPPVADPSGKTDVNGYPALLGKRVEIVPDEACVVVQIFEWYAQGFGTMRIVERLNREGLRGPRGARWREGAVKRVLANEEYRGLLIWGKKNFERRPVTRQYVTALAPTRTVAHALTPRAAHRL